MWRRSASLPTIATAFPNLQTDASRISRTGAHSRTRRSSRRGSTLCASRRPPGVLDVFAGTGRERGALRVLRRTQRWRVCLRAGAWKRGRGDWPHAPRSHLDLASAARRRAVRLSVVAATRRDGRCICGALAPARIIVSVVTILYNTRPAHHPIAHATEMQID